MLNRVDRCCLWRVCLGRFCLGDLTWCSQEDPGIESTWSLEERRREEIRGATSCDLFVRLSEGGWLVAAGCGWLRLVGCYCLPILARQRVAERIEASGTPLGLPDAAFDAPSMVQENIWEIPQ